jgi:hypothetical protein
LLKPNELPKLRVRALLPPVKKYSQHIKKVTRRTVLTAPDTINYTSRLINSFSHASYQKQIAETGQYGQKSTQ